MEAEIERKLVGRWELVSWGGLDEQGEPVAHGGNHPRGELIYRADGRMAVQISSDHRPVFGSLDLDAGDEEQKVAAYDTYNAYSGRWKVEGDEVVHMVEIALQPDQAGMIKRRPLTLSEDGDELTLQTQPVRIDGGEASSFLRWRRGGN